MTSLQDLSYTSQKLFYQSLDSAICLYFIEKTTKERTIVKDLYWEKMAKIDQAHRAAIKPEARKVLDHESEILARLGINRIRPLYWLEEYLSKTTTTTALQTEEEKAPFRREIVEADDYNIMQRNMGGFNAVKGRNPLEVLAGRIVKCLSEKTTEIREHYQIKKDPQTGVFLEADLTQVPLQETELLVLETIADLYAKIIQCKSQFLPLVAMREGATHEATLVSYATEQQIIEQLKKINTTPVQIDELPAEMTSDKGAISPKDQLEQLYPPLIEGTVSEIENLTFLLKGKVNKKSLDNNSSITFSGAEKMLTIMCKANEILKAMGSSE